MSIFHSFTFPEETCGEAEKKEEVRCGLHLGYHRFGVWEVKITTRTWKIQMTALKLTLKECLIFIQHLLQLGISNLSCSLNLHVFLNILSSCLCLMSYCSLHLLESLIHVSKSLTSSSIRVILCLWVLNSSIRENPLKCCCSSCVIKNYFISSN